MRIVTLNQLLIYTRAAALRSSSCVGPANHGEQAVQHQTCKSAHASFQRSCAFCHDAGILGTAPDAELDPSSRKCCRARFGFLHSTRNCTKIASKWIFARSYRLQQSALDVGSAMLARYPLVQAVSFPSPGNAQSRQEQSRAMSKR